MSVCPSCRRLIGRVLSLILLAGLIWTWGPAPAWAQDREPSPIKIELIVPEQAGPGTVIEVVVQYDAVDLNAGADLNYNVFGPAHILTRDPEPPNPAFNTWVPTEESAQGTIKMRVQVHEGADGQTIRHQVEVRWGIKAARFEASTLVKLLPPTATPTPQPRPRQPTAPSTPTPTQAVEAASADIELSNVSLVDLEGRPLSTAEVNQEVSLEATYASAAEAENVTLNIRFEPDVVNLDLPRVGQGYAYARASLPAAPGGGSLFEPTLTGRIRPFGSGGSTYALRAIVRLVSAEGGTEDSEQELESTPVEVHQVYSVRLSASTESDIVRAGESLIVHALVENAGSVPIEGVHLTLSELPGGFAVSPEEQTIEQVPADGGSEGKVFTIRAPQEYDGALNFYVIAEAAQMVLESDPVFVQISGSRPLSLATSASADAVYAGDTVYIDVSATNNRPFNVQNVAAKLIDVSGNLGVLVQNVGDIGPGESREWVFVVEIPDDFPSDTTASLVVQTLSDDGVISQSSEIELAVACRPRLDVFVEPPAGQLRGGDSAEVVALVKNVSQCTARGVSIVLAGLPASFVQPPAQEILELAPGEARYATFDVLVPQGFRGEMLLLGEASTEQGAQAQSPVVQTQVGGRSPLITIVFGLLVLAVAVTGIVGAVLYFQKK